jgi:hypothetical protein
MSPNYLADQTVLAAGGVLGLYRSTNGGVSWGPSSAPVLGTAEVTVLDIAVAPTYASDGTIFIGTLQNGVMRSTGGGNFAELSSFPSNYVTSVSVSPSFAADNTVFASAYHGVYASTDGGATWSFLNAPARVENSRTGSVTYTPGWLFTDALEASTGSLHSSTVNGATAVFRFYGSRVSWLAKRQDNLGKALVKLDGVNQAVVDLDNNGAPEYTEVWEDAGLPCGPHTVTVTQMPSPGLPINVDAFDVWLKGCEDVE